MMSLLSRLKNWWLAHRLNEGDAPADPGVAATREEGGDPASNARTTTGTGPSETFVGRVGGDDDGSAEITGAEARADQRKGESHG
jgi:hypothetical protein